MSDREIDQKLEKAAAAPHAVDAAVLARVKESVGSSLQPVRRLPGTFILASGLILISAAVAIAGAARAGFYGIEQLNLWQRALIFPVLIVLIWLAAAEFASEMIPGSRRWLSSNALLQISNVALLIVFALIFRDYHTDHFLSAGLACLFTGVLHAIPTALLAWLLLRRGFAVNRIAAGLAAGILGGLAGVTMLELHCSNFQAAHVLVWHTAVVPVSGGLGAFLAWILRFQGEREMLKR